MGKDQNIQTPRSEIRDALSDVHLSEIFVLQNISVNETKQGIGGSFIQKVINYIREEKPFITRFVVQSLAPTAEEFWVKVRKRNESCDIFLSPHPSKNYLIWKRPPDPRASSFLPTCEQKSKILTMNIRAKEKWERSNNEVLLVLEKLNQTRADFAQRKNEQEIKMALLDEELRKKRKLSEQHFRDLICGLEKYSFHLEQTNKAWQARNELTLSQQPKKKQKLSHG